MTPSYWTISSTKHVSGSPLYSSIQSDAWYRLKTICWRNELEVRRFPASDACNCAQESLTEHCHLSSWDSRLREPVSQVITARDTGVMAFPSPECQVHALHWAECFSCNPQVFSTIPTGSTGSSILQMKDLDSAFLPFPALLTVYVSHLTGERASSAREWPRGLRRAFEKCIKTTCALKVMKSSFRRMS